VASPHLRLTFQLKAYPTFATDCGFSLGSVGSLNKFSPNLLAVFKGRRRGAEKGIGETGVGQ